MALRAANLWRSVASRNFATATAPRLKPVAPTADIAHQGEPSSKKFMRWVGENSKGDYIPVYVALGMIVLSATLGLVTAKQQVAYNPSVRVSKKRRETIPEVVEPERVLDESDKFVNRSFFRKVAHVQDFDAVRTGTHDPTRADPFKTTKKAVTLQDVGVNPRGI